MLTNDIEVTFKVTTGMANILDRYQASTKQKALVLDGGFGTELARLGKDLGQVMPPCPCCLGLVGHIVATQLGWVASAKPYST